MKRRIPTLEQFINENSNLNFINENIEAADEKKNIGNGWHAAVSKKYKTFYAYKDYEDITAIIYAETKNLNNILKLYDEINTFDDLKKRGWGSFIIKFKK